MEAKKQSMKISAEEREADTRPQKAGEYRKPWDAFRAGCRLFKVVFEGPVLGPQKDQGLDWTGLIWDRTAVLVLP